MNYSTFRTKVEILELKALIKQKETFKKERQKIHRHKETNRQKLTCTGCPANLFPLLFFEFLDFLGV